jgi:DNA-binding NarL/FixJ family response regulator
MLRPRILLGDDHSLVLEGIKRLLEDDFEVVGSADDGATLVREAARLHPNLILLDISMPILNGIDAAREIKRELPEAKLIFISMHANSIYVRKALEVGASAYVLKSGASEELKKAIATVRAGNTYLSPGLDRDVIQDAMVPVSSRHVIELTSRQRQILQLIAEGKQNKEIASILFVSVRTVEFHRSRLMTKLGARSAAELTRFAIQEGLIPAE